MKAFIYGLLILLMAATTAQSCKSFASFSARPDPNTSTSGTIGSVKATDGALPIGERDGPRPLDTLVARH
jgi:hypothetical protein